MWLTHRDRAYELAFDQARQPALLLLQRSISQHVLAYDSIAYVHVGAPLVMYKPVPSIRCGFSIALDSTCSRFLVAQPEHGMLLASNRRMCVGHVSAHTDYR
jgi:hypothetical protein